MKLPQLIQGGMGVGVSNWRLARAVASAGDNTMGVVSGTFLDTVFARRLQDGDPGGYMRQAAAAFPNQQIVDRIFAKYYWPHGRRQNQPYINVPMFGLRPSQSLIELAILANFCEVWLAKHTHDGMVGINYLEKIQLPTLYSLYGAMLADVDCVLMGAGIPKAIPGILDRFSRNEASQLKLDLPPGTTVADDNAALMSFDPNQLFPQITQLKRPLFFAIVSSHALAINLAKKASGRVDGFVVENHTAGGHNAPPRGTMQVSENGEPVYTDRDAADLDQIAKTGIPFWVAGSYAKPEKLRDAISQGAQGIQVGTAFAYCDESGVSRGIKSEVIRKVLDGSIDIFTDPQASASGYPFKIVQLPGSLSEAEVYETRPRICDLGYLRSAYVKPDGSVGFRCPAEPADDYVKKGGDPAETCNRKCLCNGLLSTVGMAQLRKDGYEEPPLVTAGNTLSEIKLFIKPGSTTYSASEVIAAICDQS